MDQINQEYFDEFKSRFELLAGKVYGSSGPQETVSLIEQLVLERGQGKAYYSKEVLDVLESIKGSSIDLVPIRSADIYKVAQGDGLQVLKEADVGITRADFAIAETGCLVEICYDDSSKLLSSLSRVHIAVLSATNLLPKLQDFASVLRNLLSDSERGKPSVTLISGPSRTSDIELKSVLGVHGPHEVHAIFVESAT